jgi:hypothetical protein
MPRETETKVAVKTIKPQGGKAQLQVSSALCPDFFYIYLILISFYITENRRYWHCLVPL